MKHHSGAGNEERMYPLIQVEKATLLFIILLLASFMLLPPPPDGGYPGPDTAEGDEALFSLTTGIDNGAIGFTALANNATGDFNAATGLLRWQTNR